jgi:hypothetical protein
MVMVLKILIFINLIFFSKIKINLDITKIWNKKKIFNKLHVILFIPYIIFIIFILRNQFTKGFSIFIFFNIIKFDHAHDKQIILNLKK